MFVWTSRAFQCRSDKKRRYKTPNQSNHIERLKVMLVAIETQEFETDKYLTAGRDN